MMILNLLLNIVMLMGDIYKNIDEYNLGQRQKILIVFDNVIADMLNSIVIDLLVRCTNIMTWIVFIT